MYCAVLTVKNGTYQSFKKWTPSQHIRLLSSTPLFTFTVSLRADEKDAVVFAFANSLQTAIYTNGTFARNNVAFKTATSSGSALQVTLGSTVDFSNDAFAAGRNEETEYVSNSVQKGILVMISFAHYHTYTYKFIESTSYFVLIFAYNIPQISTASPALPCRDASRFLSFSVLVLQICVPILS